MANYYNYDIQTDREKRDIMRQHLKEVYKDLTDEEIEDMLGKQLISEHNKQFYRKTEPLPAQRVTEKHGELTRKRILNIIEKNKPHIMEKKIPGWLDSINDLLETGIVNFIIIIMLFVSVFLIWQGVARWEIGTTFLGIILGVLPAFKLYDFIVCLSWLIKERKLLKEKGLVKEKKHKKKKDDAKPTFKIEMYELIDMAITEYDNMDTRSIIYSLFMKTPSMRIPREFFCKYTDYCRFREGDYIFCVFTHDPKAVSPEYMFREEEWDYDEEIEKLILEAKANFNSRYY